MGKKEKRYNFKILPELILVLIFLFSSCVPNSGARSGKTGKNGSNLAGNNGAGSNLPGPGSLPGDTGVGTGTSLQSVKVELSHLVDPFDGTYKKKVSIPKNFKGNLLIAGLNISALQGKFVKARFNFGLERQSIVLNTTIARAPGIIPQTDIQVLMVDMNNKPLSKMRLPYDLYDYNDYASDPSKVPVTDPKNSGLYCRGLQLTDDPTFDNTSTTATCSGINDKCLYAYAKIADTTLYNANTNLTSIPTRPQIWSETNGVRNPSLASSALSMCLPDHEDVNGVNTLFNLSPFLTGLSFDTPILGALYRGPYRAINQNAWNIKSAAIFNGTKGLFEVAFDLNTGYRSFLFPRAGLVKLNENVRYQGSELPFSARENLVVNQTGISKYMDGCNLRVMNYDPATTEGIGSCNVVASIEIFYTKEDGSEVSIATDNSIKLQLLKPSITNFEGKEILASSFKQCESSTTCGSDECCFNKRCWSKELVTQCVDLVPVIGNQDVGANCSSDFECASLCCDQSIGACAPHNPNGVSQAFCNKTAGQRCVAREFCKAEFVPTCKLVKLSTLNQNGTVACTMRCPAVETFGQCASGICIPPVVPTPPPWDGIDCSTAVDP